MDSLIPKTKHRFHQSCRKQWKSEEKLISLSNATTTFNEPRRRSGEKLLRFSIHRHLISFCFAFFPDDAQKLLVVSALFTLMASSTFNARNEEGETLSCSKGAIKSKEVSREANLVEIHAMIPVELNRVLKRFYARELILSELSSSLMFLSFAVQS